MLLFSGDSSRRYWRAGLWVLARAVEDRVKRVRREVVKSILASFN
jgi:hypothetical protein